MPNVNAVVQTPMTLNALSAQNQQLFRETTKVHKIILGDRKLNLREIADTLKILERSVLRILHESLGVRKLFPKWVPRLLIPDQKQQRVEVSERCLELFKRGKKKFLHQKLNSGLARLWHPYFGTRMVFCLSTIMRKVKPLTATIIWDNWID